MDFPSNPFYSNPGAPVTVGADAPGENLNHTLEQVAAEGKDRQEAATPGDTAPRPSSPGRDERLHQGIASPAPTKSIPTDTDYDGTLIGNNGQPLSKLNPLSLYSRKTQNYTMMERLNSPRPSPGGVNDQELKGAWNSAYVSNSPACQARRAAGDTPGHIVYVNGINTDKAAQGETLQLIASQTCAQVIGVHNATETPIADIIQSAGDKALINSARSGKPFATHDGRNPAVDSLSDVISNSVLDARNSGGDPPPEIWCHSQGCAIASLAAYDANNRLIKSGIAEGVSGVTVRSFASAAQAWPSVLRGQHFINMQDSVPLHAGLGSDPAADSANVGPNQQVIRFQGAPGSQNPTILNPQQLAEMNRVTIDNEGNLIKNMPQESFFAYHDINTTYLNAARKVNEGM